MRTISTIVVLFTVALAQAGEDDSASKKYRGRLGSGSKKIKVEQGKTWLWAGGAKSGPDAQWYEFTDAPFPGADLQFGIGKDRIKAIDDPLFVSPDDPRLRQLIPPAGRKEKKPKTNDEIKVIGFTLGDDARAYPVGLLNHHELVNDSLGGKPVTVGW